MPQLRHEPVPVPDVAAAWAASAASAAFVTAEHFLHAAYWCNLHVRMHSVL